MLLQTTPGGQREQQMSAELLADPLIFIRRWIGEVGHVHFGQHIGVCCNALFCKTPIIFPFCTISFVCVMSFSQTGRTLPFVLTSSDCQLTI